MEIWTFLTSIVNIVLFVWRDRKLTKKEAGVGPLKKVKTSIQMSRLYCRLRSTTSVTHSSAARIRWPTWPTQATSTASPEFSNSTWENFVNRSSPSSTLTSSWSSHVSQIVWVCYFINLYNVGRTPSWLISFYLINSKCRFTIHCRQKQFKSILKTYFANFLCKIVA